MEPTAFLNVAHELLKAGASEAHIRTAVSRCYYAVFHALKNDLADTVRWAGDGSDHEKLPTFIREAMDQAGYAHRSVARHTGQLRVWRRHADYDLENPMDKPEFAYPYAQALLKEYEALDRKRLRAGIRRYLKATGQASYLREQAGT